jgi:hypothetical protein
MNKQRIKTNAVTAAANITYYGGTIGAGLAFHHLLNDSGALAIATLVVFVLTVEGLLRTLLDEVLNVATDRTQGKDTAQAVSLAKTEEATR